jgi:hypothetical protein
MRQRVLLVLFLFVFLAAPAGLAAQWPPQQLKNVKALPAGISVSSLVDTMRAFTRALGVRCTYCHVGQEGADLGTYDFVSDEKPAKVKAREMLRMVGAINGQYLAQLVDRREPAITVACATCHRGVTEPRPLQQILLTRYDRFGIDSTLATYRALRARYYGRSAYDFGEVSLVDVANGMNARGRLPDAVRVHELNMEVLPQSGFAHRQAADAYVAMGDTTRAVASLNRALVINPQDATARQQLEAIRTGRK